MIPPWQKFSHIPLGSIGWRMGAGEEYWLAFDDWFKRKSLEAKILYVKENPEPDGWEGFYRRKG
jgi:hypothetical protein